MKGRFVIGQLVIGYSIPDMSKVYPPVGRDYASIWLFIS